MEYNVGCDITMFVKFTIHLCKAFCGFRSPSLGTNHLWISFLGHWIPSELCNISTETIRDIWAPLHGFQEHLELASNQRFQTLHLQSKNIEACLYHSWFSGRRKPMHEESVCSITEYLAIPFHLSNIFFLLAMTTSCLTPKRWWILRHCSLPKAPSYAKLRDMKWSSDHFCCISFDLSVAH